MDEVGEDKGIEGIRRQHSFDLPRMPDGGGVVVAMGCSSHRLATKHSVSKISQAISKLCDIVRNNNLFQDRN